MEYLLKVNVALVLFYAFYKLLLGEDTFFAWRRGSLLLIVVVSAVLPLLEPGEWIETGETFRAITDINADNVLPELFVSVGAATAGNVWEEVITTCMSFLYWGVFAALAVRFIIQLASILLLSRRSRRYHFDGVTVRVPEKKQAPFSFFTMIFVNPEVHDKDELREIMSHELAHVRQWHSLDVVIFEMLSMVLWYNPFVWLMKREVRNNLEYLADNRVLNEGHDTRKYQYHLLGLTYQKAAANLYNNFNVLPLKKRIKMMNKERTREIGKLKYLLFLPLTAVLLVGCNAGNSESVKSEETVVVEDTVMEVKTPETPTAEQKEEPKVDSSKAFRAVEEMPQFPGGDAALMKYLRDNISYPQRAVEKGIQGRVVVQFVVTKTGEIGEVKVIRGVDSDIDNEAIRLCKSLPKFIPGKMNGQVVDVWYTLPVTFALK